MSVPPIPPAAAGASRGPPLSFGNVLVSTDMVRVPTATELLARTRADGVALPEDTLLVMAPVTPLDPGDGNLAQDAGRLAAEATALIPQPVGAVLAHRWGANGPLVFRCVLHDFERMPSLDPGMVDAMMRELPPLAARMGVTRLAMPPLGVSHDGISLVRFVKAVVKAARHWGMDIPRESPEAVEVPREWVICARSREELAKLRGLFAEAREEAYH